MDVYINAVEKFLPGKPVSNDEMESYLGKINGTNSKARPIVLKNNGIKTRYYAIDKNQKSVFSNAQLTVEAIKKLQTEHFTVDDIQLLACGTTSPDQLLPSHASMVHGELKTGKTEYSSFGGSCNAGMLAMKYAWFSVASGNTENAVCSGSEKLSTWLIADRYKKEADKISELEKKPILAFSKEFLRWMLSDGAAAALLENKPNIDGISLKIEWIEITSFAGEIETCMYAGGKKDNEGNLIPWKDLDDEYINENSLMVLQQDTRLLGSNIVKKGAEFLAELTEKHNFRTEDIHWFLPHLSSMFFKDKIYEEMKANGIYIAEDKWFLNLPYVGNVGSASAYLMLEELFNSGKLKKGEKILVMVPESARFSYTYMMLTVV